MARSRFQAPRAIQSFDEVQRALREVQESLDAVSQLRAELRVRTTDFAAVAGSFHRVTAPLEGLAVRMPKASPSNLSEPVVLHLEGLQGDVVVWAAPGDQVNGTTTATFNTDGVVVLWSNGVSAWSGVAQTPVGGAGTPTWAQTLTSGNTSGASNPTLDAGQRLIVPGGQSAGDGDIHSDSDVTVDAATDIHLHAAGNIHVGHQGETQDIHAEAQTIELLTDTNGISASATTTVNITAGASSTVETGTFFAVNAAGQIVLQTGGIERLEIESTGAWQLGGSVGTAGQALVSAGAGAPPVWDYAVEVETQNEGVLGKARNIAFLNGVNSTAVGIDNGSNQFLVRFDVDLSSVTYTPGFGLDLVANEFSVDVTDFDSTSIVESGGALVRAAITGAVSIGQNSNSSLFAGIQDNGVAETAQAGLNFASSTSVGFAVAQDGANNRMTVSATRSALSGAISASSNSNTTLFSGIRDNGSAENDRGNLNVVSTSFIGLAWTDDSANDELELRATFLGSIYAENDAGAIQTPFVSFDDGDSMLVSVTDNTAGSGYVNVSYSYAGNAVEQTITSATGNLGTIDISSLPCGGCVRVSTASSAYSIEGFTAKTAGFWFDFIAETGVTNHCTLFDEDATATSANRLSLPRDQDMLEQPQVRGRFTYRNSRWHFTGANQMVIGVSGTSYMGFLDTTGDAEIATAASAITLTPGGSNDINLDGANVDVNATNMTLTPVPRSDGGVLGGNIDGWGPVFMMYRDVTSSGSSSAGDTQFFNANAPFAFQVLATGLNLTTGQATAPAGTQNMFRSASGGGGSAMSSQFSTLVAAQGTIQYGASGFTGLSTVSAGGTFVFRWADRRCVGRVWALCARLS